MNSSSKAIALIKEFEGLRLEPYKDIAGFLTIGYGHKIVPPSTYSSITTEDAEKILAADIALVESQVKRMVTSPLVQNQFDALVDFVFNLGAGRLLGSTLLRKINAGDIAGAASEILKWDHSGGVEVDGLKRRREAEYQLWNEETTA